MSMHQIEDFVEAAIHAVALSDLNIQQKRDTIHTLFEMESYGDCSFTNLRTIEQMVSCQYTFLFDAGQIGDPEGNPALSDAYLDDDTGKYCIDSGSEAWKEMVSAGMISGEGANPVSILPFIDVLKLVKPLMGTMDSYIRDGFYALTLITGAFDDMDDDDCIAIFGMSKDRAEALLEGEDPEDGDDSTSKDEALCQGTYLIMEQECTFHLQDWEEAGDNPVKKKLHGEITALKAFGQEVPFYADITTNLNYSLYKEEDREAMAQYMLGYLKQMPLDNFVAELNNQLAFSGDKAYIDLLAQHYAAARGLSTNCQPNVSRMWCEYTLSPLGTQCDLFIRIESPDQAYSFDIRLRNGNEIVREGNAEANS